MSLRKLKISEKQKNASSQQKFFDDANLVVAHERGSMADAVELGYLEARHPLFHFFYCLRKKNFRVGAVQYQGRAGDLAPDVPQVDAAQQAGADRELGVDMAMQ